MPIEYRNHYGVSLLDDLHNYFPDILYRPEQFQTLASVFQYIQLQIQTHFNLFDLGRREFIQSNPPNLQNPPISPRINRHRVIPPEIETEIRISPLQNLDYSFDTISNLFTLVNQIQRTPSRGQNLPRTQEDVVVHATPELIATATVERTLDEDLEELCTICQDHMVSGELVRKLNVCEHEFHRSCIDNWLLQRSVYCPTCRYDIRSSERSVQVPVETPPIQTPPIQTPPIQTPPIQTPPIQTQLRAQDIPSFTDGEVRDIVRNALFGSFGSRRFF
jgi:hypothetical protein